MVNNLVRDLTVLDQPDAIASLRAFNRFYTRIMGLLEEGLLKSPFPLAEARVIHEVGQKGHVTAGSLADGLGMDRGQLSRLIKRLSAAGMLGVGGDEQDRRISRLTLTAAGQEVCETLNRLSDQAAAAIIAPLGAGERGRLLAAMGEIARLLEPVPAVAPLVLRPPRVGEIGWLIHRQAELYNREYGWNAEFEALLARIYADFIAVVAPERKALWIAQIDGGIAGSAAIVPAGEPGVAKLRTLYVEPRFRGRGVGRRLVEEAIGFARQSGFERMTLWTHDCLVTARRIYVASGFELVSEHAYNAFGHDLVEQVWSLDLARPVQ